VLTKDRAGGKTRRIRGALAPLLHWALLSRSAVSRIVGHAQAQPRSVTGAPPGRSRGRLRLLRRPHAAGVGSGKVVRLPVLTVVGVLADG
jgi:hypothetical protein